MSWQPPDEPPSSDPTPPPSGGDPSWGGATPPPPPPPPGWNQPAAGYPQQQPYGGYGGAPPTVPNYLVFSILTTLFCCLPAGVVSIVYASQVNGKLAAGDYAGAEKASTNARTWAIVSARGRCRRDPAVHPGGGRQFVTVALAPGPVERFAARHPWVAPAGAAVAAGATCLALAVADPRAGDNPWPACPFHAVTGGDCPGCGSLRAVRSLLSGDLLAAAGYNVLAVLALPLLVLAWFRWARGTPLVWSNAFVRALPWVVGVWWVARNLPFQPFLALGAN